jgi:hypothetical protein
MPRFVPRISLLSAILLTTIFGMGIVIFVQWRELGPLQSEVRQMRTQLGLLTIEDPSRVHAIEVRQPDSNLWRWRIYLPFGRKYRLVEFGGRLPARGLLSTQQWFDVLTKASIGRGEYSGMDLAGEFTLEASFTQVDGQWKFETHPGGGSAHYAFTDNWPAHSYRLAPSDVWKASNGRMNRVRQSCYCGCLSLTQGR